nr:NAD-dependent DNA ligase [uncultured phage]CAI9752305.1 NAD-dependent DNA ligase [uncultured phage]
MKELEKIVLDNAKAYYTTGSQELSDDVFDAVVDKIREDNPDSSVLSTGWGYKPDSDDKIKHKYCHVGSLQKVKTIADFHNKMGFDSQYNIAAKLDGMSCVLYFEKGKIVKALTRGDGEYGIDITEKLHYVKGFTYSIKDKTFTGAVRGEILMTPADYNKFKFKYHDAKNARNSTAGIMNSNVESVSPEDYGFLSLYVYTVTANENEIKSDCYVYDLYKWLTDNFECVAPFTQGVVNEPMLIALKEQWNDFVVMDGLVITKNNIQYDVENKTYNYEQIAWKFQDEIKITTVVNIQWEMSKHQAYIPVVNIEPIELEGTTVKKVTGYNAKWIKDIKIKTGSVVAVRKSNQVIPQIVEVIK